MSRIWTLALCYIKKTFYVVRNDVGRQFRSVNFYVVCFFMLLFWYLFTWNIKGLAHDCGFGITPYLQPHFFADSIYGVYGKLLLVLFTCNIPFFDGGRMYDIYSICRIGKSVWFLGKIMYIIVVNIIYGLLFWLFQVIALIPFVSFAGNWGSVLYSAAKDSSLLADYSGYGSVSDIIISDMGPLQAVLWQMLLCILVGSVIGIITFMINGLSGKHIGSLFMVGLVLAADFLNQIDTLFGTGLSKGFFFQWLDLSGYLTGTYQLETATVLLAGIFVLLAVISYVFVKVRWIKTAE